MDYQVQIY